MKYLKEINKEENINVYYIFKEKYWIKNGFFKKKNY